MLDPRDRRLLLELLRPPDGYRLSGAIGTSYTLDLVALLTAPLAFTLHDREDEEGNTLVSALAVLEPVRRHAEKITLFCQAGEIKVPAPTQRLIAYLERCTAAVNAPHRAGVFHPKIWLLRFTREDQPVRYRLLCLSRNLTFDKCWDSVLSLDGELIERNRAFAANHPLGDFVAALPSMTVKPLVGIPESAHQHHGRRSAGSILHQATAGAWMNTEPWVSVEGVAQHLGVAKDSIYRWNEVHSLPAHKIGRLWKFKLSEVYEWVRAVGAETHGSKRDGIQ